MSSPVPLGSAVMRCSTVLSAQRPQSASGTMRGTLVRSSSLLGNELVDGGGNTVDSTADVSSVPPPPLPDLDSVWHP